jgi:uncharacterized cupredoxin-like copper-binding protein
MRAAALLIVLALTAGCGGAAERTVEIEIRHSRFVPATVEVEPGQDVRFVIRNLDPIDHEFIVGDDEVHARHRDGTEPFHGTVPGEVSIPPVAERATTYRFEGPGTVVFACHLPGHLAFGMRGTVRVA